MKRKIVRVDTPTAQPGFLGKGHMARPVIQSSFSESDPFIMLMDDMLDKKMIIRSEDLILMPGLKR
jgi:quercetin 2,3-dioxygenase